ncbi:MAG: DUF7527 domain-containing protein, partial [Halodesulfurarchaeum sp.]
RQTETRSRDHPGAPATRRTRAATEGSVGAASDLEIRSIPSLDPAKSWGTAESGPQASTVPVPPPDAGRNESVSQDPPGNRQDPQDPTGGSMGEPGQSGDPASEPIDSTDRAAAGTKEASEQQPSDAARTEARVTDLEEIIDEREARIEDLEDRVETTEAKREALETERDEIKAERDDLRAELSEARTEIDSLREERDALEAQLEGLDIGADGVTHRLSRTEAIEGTNLFVRYGSKSAPTLSAARESGVSQSDVRDNLSVEYHTQFEAEGTLVEGKPFEEFLENTMEHRYVSWVVGELLFEIRDTGHQEELADLYDALPLVDRIELNGSVGVEFTENGQTNRSQESFDVVFRDRMGNPLVVANMNDSRQAATENQMNSLVTAGTRVGETSESLAGAMFVTSSFFEPAALETTAEATSGGLLSRDKRQSFVKLSRKQGYHLCLVEARADQFHMAVPEL